MTEENFYIGQIFENEYPPEAAEWCNNHQDCYIKEIESIIKESEDIVGEDEEGNSIPESGVIRRFQITEITPETNEEKRARLDALTLTPADVERALYMAKSYDFADLQKLIAQKLPEIDTKGLAIEFRASTFYRGATLKDGTRLFDVVGALLGYTPDDMDYLFLNKTLPEVENDEVLL